MSTAPPKLHIVQPENSTDEHIAFRCGRTTPRDESKPSTSTTRRRCSDCLAQLAFATGNEPY